MSRLFRSYRVSDAEIRRADRTHGAILTTRSSVVQKAEGLRWIEQKMGWIVIGYLEQIQVARQDYNDSEELMYYCQALTDDEVFVFHIFQGERPAAEEDEPIS